MADAPPQVRPVSLKPIVSRPDLATIGGLVLAVGGIVGRLLLEGGRIRDVAQITAAVIVFGGTFGAVMVTTPYPVLVRAPRKLTLVFVDRARGPVMRSMKLSVLPGKPAGTALFRLNRTPITYRTRFCERP
jgi:chemotaxis protein MotA